MVKRPATGLRYGEGTIRERPGLHGTGWQARWVDDAAGKLTERSKTFATRDEAEDFLREQMRAKRDGRYQPPSQMTVKQIIAAYLDRGVGRWKPNTEYVYRQRARLYIEPALGECKIAALTTPRIQHWIDGLTKSGKTPTLIKAVAVVLKQALREATAIGVIASNPAIGIRLPTTHQERATVWTGDEVARVIAATASEPMWHALYRLALTSGLRPGELRALTWRDVDLEAGVATVRRTMSRDRDGHTTIGASTKTGADRAVALAPSAVRALIAYRATLKIVRLDGVIFDQGHGRPLDPAHWRLNHKRFADAADASVITLHELRHTVATLELEAGTHPLIVSQRLGHKKIQTTLDIYSHVSPALQHAAARALDKRLFGDEETVSHATTEGAGYGEKR